MIKGPRQTFSNDLVASFNQDLPPKAAVKIAGDDTFLGGIRNESFDGGPGNDTIDAGPGNDVLLGGPGADRLTGGPGFDQLLFAGDLFANGAPLPAGQTGINVLNRPDVITDFTFGEDRFTFVGQDLGIENFVFQQGVTSQIAADGNALVLLDAFPAAGAAARAIANNPNITSDEGVFIYFNSTLGLTRLVYSQDLGDGGNISVLANLDNQRGPLGQANLAIFTPTDFNVV
ncbi:hypothetical protein [Leptothermofonsia sp. ETS-13]|uniref:hypothetical protein n=1 Tax=Leptothermofonsia sp. ETS-13 TaxID=3035696 RepID=UPI003B9DF592